ncbi:ABC transporter permease subunit [Roseibacillus ishigakijimensis]|uniref:ABC transporter permease subunit n=1 Tax=Roseibacillus ishigakijimensis TaxID=454146 RepID=A0A934RTT4_9BACT|nr:ABC transporter permease subunit [Roseibacillus ishigakijimensis]MBK1835526.1 ABC transporter permease subunit [Roseibacillus ishigakijimensis]
MAKLVGWILMLGATLAGVAYYNDFRLPAVGWGFQVGDTMADVIKNWSIFQQHLKADWTVTALDYLGWALTILSWVLGAWLVASFSGATRFRPLTLRRMQRFREIKRGYWSLVILLLLGFLASLDFILVGSEALAIRHKGQWTFPAFTRTIEKGEDYGLEGEGASGPPDYGQLQADWKAAKSDSLVIMPPLPYAPTGDAIPALSTPLKEEGGVLYEGKRKFNGYASKVYDLEKPEFRHLSYRFRDGLRDGRAEGWDENQERVYGATYREGKLVIGSESYSGTGPVDRFLARESSELVRVHFQPAPPSREHWLGTTAQGYDVIAYLYGGLQANFQAALVYIPLVYAVGVTIGLLMGYFGGTFDLIVQRVIEILSNIPFLFVVMIISLSVPARMKEDYGLWIIVGILALFGWMGMTYLMRTAALKEKARDYVAASRVMGASTPRILTKHLLPNSVSIVVTLVPFSISGLVMSLASLDYLGFGVPTRYATWGKLLREGLENLSSPWLAATAFCALVILLILVTFVGEAVREAFDPKKFSFYK